MIDSIDAQFLGTRTFCPTRIASPDRCDRLIPMALPSKVWPEITRLKALELYSTGMTIDSVSKHLGVPKSTVGMWVVEVEQSTLIAAGRARMKAVISARLDGITDKLLGRLEKALTSDDGNVPDDKAIDQLTRSLRALEATSESASGDNRQRGLSGKDVLEVLFAEWAKPKVVKGGGGVIDVPAIGEGEGIPT